MLANMEFYAYWVHAGIQKLLSGGVQAPTARKQPAWTMFFFSFSLVLIYFTVYRGGPMVLLQRKLYFPKDPEWVQHFPGRGPTFSGGGGGGGGGEC